MSVHYTESKNAYFRYKKRTSFMKHISLKQTKKKTRHVDFSSNIIVF